MKRFGMAVAAVLAFTGSANAGPWQHDEKDYGHLAWQESKDGKYQLGFMCGEDADDGAFYIRTSERYEATTSYADAVPTTFASNGKTLEMSGVFETRAGMVSVYFDSMSKLALLYDLIANAKGDIKINFFDKQMSFSSEGSAAALEYAAPGSPDNCNPWGM
ncbi:MAG: hypothetical protein IPM67_13030 [Sphingomonadales bacterium]|jgi:hypothetical protein|nr:hypothetical protein [Sphingomonadales bacterium]MBK9269545.1 hypothetical protein [Sphingomonadales bacterium]MBP6434346.1 hypothetical protein [Sphingorhabdus sp.]